MPTTHKPASPTSIFSFVQVRAPRKISAAAEEQHFYKYDADNPSAFVASLIAIKNNATSDNASKVTEIRAAATSFKESTASFTTKTSLSSFDADILAMAEHISTNRSILKHADFPEGFPTGQRRG